MAIGNDSGNRLLASVIDRLKREDWASRAPRRQRTAPRSDRQRLG
jgi:hypothetical protein